ncbi:MAG TPA: hypothetical protein VFD51_02455 [Patescibacteria group bacterium]|nr:hypothetical protein [Patescibacteria group bacterium]
MNTKNKITNILKVKSWPAIVISLLIFFTAFVYYIYALNLLGIFISLFLTFTSFFILFKLNFLELNKEISIEDKINLKKITKNDKLIILSYFIFLGAAFLELFSATSVKSLISPWEVVNYSFFIFYIFSLFFLILIIKKQLLNSWHNSILLSIQLFLSLSVALIVYKIGYGFDPFIHQAAMEIIAKNGFISPKTPYYLGEYGLLTSINQLSGLSLTFLNKILVPISAALILPKLTYNLIKQIANKDDKFIEITAWLSTLIALCFSFYLFIVTTPQNFSYLFLFLAIFSGLIDKLPTRSFVFSFAALAIHPIAGIPAIIWSSWLFFKLNKQKLHVKWHKPISAIILSVGSLLIPLALFISSGAKLENIKLSFANFTNPLKSLFNFKYAGSENWLLNATYTLYNHYQLIIIILILCGLYIFINNKFLLKKTAEKNYAWRGLISINISLLFAFILSSQINFSELIAYEQGGFSNRILTIIIIFSSPFLVLSIFWLIKRVFSFQENKIKLIWLVLIVSFISASLYLAYPRFDKYYNSRGYSTSSLDIEAVTLIDNLAQSKYIVLANQQVSAAALKAYGFNHYYKSQQGTLYFYPIPTGGVLYQYYLDMVYMSPSKETMKKAMSLVEVDEAYLVINKYWNDSGKIIKAAKLEANSWTELGNNDIFIFQYKK